MKLPFCKLCIWGLFLKWSYFLKYLEENVYKFARERERVKRERDRKSEREIIKGFCEKIANLVWHIKMTHQALPSVSITPKSCDAYESKIKLIEINFLSIPALFFTYHDLSVLWHLTPPLKDMQWWNMLSMAYGGIIRSFPRHLQTYKFPTQSTNYEKMWPSFHQGFISMLQDY